MEWERSEDSLFEDAVELAQRSTTEPPSFFMELLVL